MSTKIQSANDSLKGYHGGEQLFFSPVTKINYTEGVREIAKKTESYWFLDIIASYQSKLKNEHFQVWKLERELAYTMVNGFKNIVQRKDCFNVICEDGNDNVLISQKIPFSDFCFDVYTLWYVNKVLLLPVEY
ncbi:hypothetical protein B0A67_24640 [Flavobacterium aquidurense]|uniref:DUF6876 family protein n=1 Tax=Flavobacterium aquidurense TaxID=362413 RepID=UPI0009237AD7|nr:DUF6876 family protein [Flavobacterium aquidurense]OXA65258.1 hypothetical protein B0A67_24640 [Flavobacterium aquidurense]SHH89220.1 hypothetical protein SAMN05444481_14112 [Flavobacterium frigidimaris]